MVVASELPSVALIDCGSSVCYNILIKCYIEVFLADIIKLHYITSESTKKIKFFLENTGNNV